MKGSPEARLWTVLLVAGALFALYLLTECAIDAGSEFADLPPAELAKAYASGRLADAWETEHACAAWSIGLVMTAFLVGGLFACVVGIRAIRGRRYPVLGLPVLFTQDLKKGREATLIGVVWLGVGTSFLTMDAYMEYAWMLGTMHAGA